MITRDLTIEGVTFKLAPTPLYKLVNCRALLAAGALDTEEGITALETAIFWGARRAGSEITLEWLQMNIDGHNAPEVFAAFREINAVKESAAGEAPAASSPTS